MSEPGAAGEPRTLEEWDAYRALPEWVVTAVLSRTARFRVHAVSAEEARATVLRRENGVQSVEDLYDPGELRISSVSSVEEVTGR